MVEQGIGEWLKEKCQKEELSSRQVAARTGLSHGTICEIIGGKHPLPETIQKLAQGFADGTNESFAIEDKLLVLAGYRSERPEGMDLNEEMARLIDKLSNFNEPQLQMMIRFAEFLRDIVPVLGTKT